MTIPNPLHVRPDEYGIVRVFTTDLEPEGDAAISPANIERLLGEDIELDSKKVEVFPTGMIESLGLPAYLREGYGISSEEMAGKAAVLDALSGLVILIPSSAFKGDEVTLDPNPGLRFVAAFREEKSEPPIRMERSQSSDVVAPVSPHSPDERAARGRMRSWIVALGALILAAIVVLLFI